MKNVNSDQLFEICRNIPDAICIIDTEWNIRAWNNGAKDMFGYEEDEVIGKSIALIIPKEIARQEIEYCKNELNTKGKITEYETVRVAKDGRIVPVELSAVLLHDVTGVPAYAAIMRDITERKRMELQLVESEASLRTIFNSSNDAIFVHEIESGRILEVNEKFYEMYGGSPEDVARMDVEAISAGTPGYRNEDALRRIKKAVEGEPQSFEWMAKNKTGNIFWVEVNLRRINLRGTDRILATVRDITERKQAENSLRQAYRLTETIIDSMNDPISLIDVRDFTILRVNRVFLQKYGYSDESEIAGKHCYEITHHRSDVCSAPDDICPLIETVKTREHFAMDHVHYDRQGEKVYVEVSTSPIKDETGNVIQVVHVQRDITERKRAEAALRESKDALKRAYADLEIKVRERTRDLAKTNEELKVEITERGRAVELIKKSHELSDALNNLNTVIHSTLDFEEIMKRVVRGAAEAIKVDGSSIGLIHDTTFQIRYVHNMAAHLAGWAVPLHQLTGVRAAATSGEPIAFNDARHDQRLNLELVRKWGFQSMLVSPLIIKKRMAGAIVFYSFSSLVVFQQEHIDFARKLAASISLAMENAELYQALKESDRISASRFEQLQSIYDTAPIGLCLTDTSNRYISINKTLAEIDGLPVEKIIGRTVREVIPPVGPRVESICNQVVRTGKPVSNIEIHGKMREEQDERYFMGSFYPIRDHQGRIFGVNTVVQDITERKKAEEALRTSERVLNALLNSIPDIAWLKDSESRFILVNEPFGKACGKDPDELVGKTDFDAWPRELAEKYRADDFEVMKLRLPKRVEEPLAGLDGASRWIETIKTPIYNEQGMVVGTAGIARDTTERKRMEEQIRHMALHDPLTGLPNRRMFLDILNLEIAQARRHEKKIAILFLDLDRFKEINDTLGHDVGDRLLKQVAGRFRATIRESDTVARIGGDEFNMVLADITRPDDVSDIAVKIVNSLARPVLLKGHELNITTSVGISIYPDDSEEVETLLRFADIAMYHAKEYGRNTFRFYNPSINVKSIERMKLESYLRQTVKRGELSVLYQPLIDIKSKKICYAEALVRWRHPDRGVLDPKEFIPLAEETGFITTIDEWVLRTACRQARSWKDAGLHSFCLTVNLSARQFQSPGLVSMIASVLRETGVPPDCLDLEVTESTAMSNVERSAAQLRELRDIGVHISIDDFGTGYSSLTYLKKLPIERLKIDRSFVQEIARDADDRAIISAVISMARKMGIRTVAEGVETEEQLEFLRQAECDEAQGFLFSTPVSAEKFSELVSHH